MSDPVIWWYQLWQFVASTTSSGSCCGLKHQEYSPTFYRVMPNMCIICRIRNDCLCWLFLVTVDIIRDWLPQVTELCFLRGCWTGLLYCTKYYVFTTIWPKTIIWGPFYGFKSKRLFRMNLMHGNTDNISYVPILTWPGMTSSLTSHGLVNYITQYFSLNSFLVLPFDKNVPLETSMESFKGELMFGKFAFSFN